MGQNRNGGKKGGNGQWQWVKAPSQPANASWRDQQSKSSKPPKSSPPDPSGRPQRKKQAPPLSWVEAGWQDWSQLRSAPPATGSYAGAAARANSATPSSGDASTQPSDALQAQDPKAAALKAVKEAEALAISVTKAGCSETESRSLWDDHAAKKQRVWTQFTEAETQLDLLDQKAGRLLAKINKHSEVLQRHDEAIDKARDVVAEKVKERIEYANKLPEWQIALEETKREIAQCKTTIASGPPQQQQTAPAPPKEEKHDSSFPERLATMLVLFMDKVGAETNPELAGISAAIREEISGTKAAGYSSTSATVTTAPAPVQSSQSHQDTGAGTATADEDQESQDVDLDEPEDDPAYGAQMLQTQQEEDRRQAQLEQQIANAAMAEQQSKAEQHQQQEKVLEEQRAAEAAAREATRADIAEADKRARRSEAEGNPERPEAAQQTSDPMAIDES